MSFSSSLSAEDDDLSSAGSSSPPLPSPSPLSSASAPASASPLSSSSSWSEAESDLSFGLGTENEKGSVAEGRVEPKENKQGEVPLSSPDSSSLELFCWDNVMPGLDGGVVSSCSSFWLFAVELEGDLSSGFATVEEGFAESSVEAVNVKRLEVFVGAESESLGGFVGSGSCLSGVVVEENVHGGEGRKLNGAELEPNEKAKGWVALSSSDSLSLELFCWDNVMPGLSGGVVSSCSSFWLFVAEPEGDLSSGLAAVEEDFAEPSVEAVNVKGLEVFVGAESESLGGSVGSGSCLSGVVVEENVNG